MADKSKAGKSRPKPSNGSTVQAQLVDQDPPIKVKPGGGGLAKVGPLELWTPESRRLLDEFRQDVREVDSSTGRIFYVFKHRNATKKLTKIVVRKNSSAKVSTTGTTVTIEDATGNLAVELEF